MREKVFDKLVDEVTERVVLRILNGHFVCYQCGERSIKERFEKLEQEVTKHLRAANDVEIVRCKDCKYLTDEQFGYCSVWKQYICSREEFFCACGERRQENGKAD